MRPQLNYPLISFLLLLTPAYVNAQEIKKELRSFHSVIASPRIHLILEQGDKEEIRLVYNNVSEDKINIEVKKKTLRIYLDNARVTEKQERIGRYHKRGIYEGASVTAYVTYRDLKNLQIRGNQELTCNGNLSADKLVLKAYGENDITLASIHAGYFKTSLYGENRLRVKGGKADFQKYRLFGENKIDSQDLKSFAATANTYGESKVRLTTHDQLRVNALGESEISYAGGAHISRGLVLGNTTIRRLNE
jgi:hypothetical protein